MVILGLHWGFWGYIRIKLGLHWEYIGAIFGLYWGSIRVLLGFREACFLLLEATTLCGFGVTLTRPRRMREGGGGGGGVTSFKGIWVAGGV